MAPVPDIATLRVSKQAGPDRATLSWTDGVSPFVVVRSETPDFKTSTTITYIDRNLASTTADDPTLYDGKNYFYYIADFDARPFILTNSTASFTTQTPTWGGTYTADGWGFRDDATNVFLLLGGEEIPATTAEPSQVTFPLPIGGSAGNALIYSANGTCDPFALHLAISTGFSSIWGVAVDSVGDIFVADGGSNDRIWKVGGITGTKITCVTGAEPIGLGVNENGYLIWGTHNYTSANFGTVRAAHPDTCANDVWGPSGASGDPVDPRATAWNRSGANNGCAFILDHYGDRIRRKSNGLPGCTDDKFWMTGLGLLGNNSAASEPGGLTFNTSGHVFFTGPNRVDHYDNTRTFVETWDAADGLDHPGGLDIDDLGNLWVANRGLNNVLEIRYTPGDQRIIRKIDTPATPRVLTTRRETDGYLYIYLGTPSAVYKYRVGDTVRLNITVLNEAKVRPCIAGLATCDATEEQIRKVIQAEIDTADSLFRQCGLQVLVEAITFINDPNAAGGTLEKGLSNHTGGAWPNHSDLTNQELTLLTTNRHSDPGVINVYYIRNFLNSVGGVVNTMGRTYTDDYSWTTAPHEAIANGSLSAIIMARQADSDNNGSLNAWPSTVVLVHEIGHFLLNLTELGFDEHYNDPDTEKHLIMYKHDEPAKRTFTSTDCTNMTGNTDEAAQYIFGY